MLSNQKLIDYNRPSSAMLILHKIENCNIYIGDYYKSLYDIVDSNDNKIIKKYLTCENLRKAGYNRWAAITIARYVGNEESHYRGDEDVLNWY